MNTNAPEPGIYLNIPFEEYLSWPYVNNSSLSYAARSMAHYRYAPPIQPTAAMRFGSLVHCGKLEPAAIGARYAVMPDFSEEIRKEDGSRYSNVRATKAYKEAVAAWRETIGDREECSADELEIMLGIVQSLVMHDRSRLWLCSDGPCELSIVWDDVPTGIRCKGRIDKLCTGTTGHVLVDLKTTRDASDFQRSIARFGYHRQAAFYSDGLKTLTGIDNHFALVIVEKDAPYGVRAALMSEEARQVGQDQYRQLLEQLAACRQSDHWPGYSDPHEWQLPSWYSPQNNDDELELTINGEIVRL